METKLGHIKIKDKVYFVPERLSKPIYSDYIERRNWAAKTDFSLKGAIKKYEASKKTVEVSNDWYEFSIGIFMVIDNKIKNIKDRQPCEAEVTDKAIITKIL